MVVLIHLEFLVLLLGMLRRERTGPAGIGFESVLVLLLYAGSVVLIFL